MKRIIPSFALVASFCAAWLLLASTCEQKQESGEPVETATTGKATILCDESIAERLKPAAAYFDSSYAEAKVEVVPVSAREGMSQLFATKARGLIISRPYLADEDSVLKANKLPPHATTIIATDALVFYVQRDFPLDTISLDQLKQLFTDKKATLQGMFPQLKAEPTFVCPDANSSEYGNILLMLTKNAAPQAKMTLVKNADTARKVVAANPNAIGVGYLWHNAGDKQFKMLKIGFQDTTGAYIRPKTVHQAYLVMGKYPLAVSIRGVILEDRRNLPWGFMTFLRNDVRAKQYFLKSGIVPEGAKFDLVPTDEED
ncbi:MAG: substrate-binding domain-containing protein [Candidatus Kapabacteria bacterium]|jgi:ABC-type phosphate transport system substrate-binding protein|nr:substrate-binding domain-containing protein [Candidatus Kapabacteria bacterium]